jgi:hypothetical protein
MSASAFNHIVTGACVTIAIWCGINVGWLLWQLLQWWVVADDSRSNPRRKRLARSPGTGAAMTVIYIFAAFGMVVATIIAAATIVGITAMISAAIAERPRKPIDWDKVGGSLNG